MPGRRAPGRAAAGTERRRRSPARRLLDLAAIGIVQKVERFPLNIGIGICLGMIPLIGYNYAARNYRRMKAFFTAARVAGLIVAAFSVLMYYLFADRLIGAFINDAQTVRLGISFLRARCFATPFMFLSFNMICPAEKHQPRPFRPGLTLFSRR